MHSFAVSNPQCVQCIQFAEGIHLLVSVANFATGKRWNTSWILMVCVIGWKWGFEGLG